MAEIRYERAGRRFGDVVALEEFSLEIHDGEFMVFVGPSGSGKTTALRLLAGLESLSTGHIWIGSHLVDRVSPRQRDLAMVFQDYALYPQMTVFQNLAFGLRMRKVARREIAERVRQAAEMLEIGDLLGRRPGQLSGGQRQRVALGRALVREPRAFLMDEPLSNLDAKLRVQMRGEIKSLQERVGTTTVYVTHDQVEAMTMGDRIAVMRGGLLEQVGDPDSVYDHPVNMFVAGFVGSPAMAFGAFSTSLNGESLRVHRGGIEFQLPARDVPPESIVGVRPEHARLWGHGANLVGPLTGRLEYLETLGYETFMGVKVDDGVSFVVRAEGRVRPRIGDAVSFGFDRGCVHLFDPDSGRMLERV